MTTDQALARVVQDPRRLGTPWKCPEVDCTFTSTWTPAILNHKEKESRLRGRAPPLPTQRPTPPPPSATPRPPPAQPKTPKRRKAEDLTLERVEKIAELVAERVVTNRQHRLMRGFGMTPLTGRIQYIQEGSTWRARIDGHDIIDMLRLTFNEGNEVSALFADARVLRGDEPQQQPPTGTRQQIYRPNNQYGGRQ